MNKKEAYEFIRYNKKVIVDGNTLIENLLKNIPERSRTYISKRKLSKHHKEYIFAVLILQRESREKIKGVEYFLGLNDNEVFNPEGGGRFNLNDQNEIEIEDILKKYENNLKKLKSQNNKEKDKIFMIECCIQRIKNNICKKAPLTCLKNKIMSKFAGK